MASATWKPTYVLRDAEMDARLVTLPMTTFSVPVTFEIEHCVPMKMLSVPCVCIAAW